MGEDLGDDFGGCEAFDFEFGAEDEAVGEGGGGDALDVVGGDEVAEFEGGVSAGGTEEGLGAAGAGAGQERFGGTGAADDLDDVGDHFVAHADLAEGGLEGDELATGEDGADGSVGEAGFGGVAVELALGEFDLFGAVEIADFDFELEAVFLRFGERVGAFVFDGVLRGEDGELGGSW